LVVVVVVVIDFVCVCVCVVGGRVGGGVCGVCVGCSTPHHLVPVDGVVAPRIATVVVPWRRCVCVRERERECVCVCESV
jgi:hypothetical protein